MPAGEEHPLWILCCQCICGHVVCQGAGCSGGSNAHIDGIVWNHDNACQKKEVILRGAGTLSGRRKGVVLEGL